MDIQYNSDAYSNLPWLELASLGIYKMFSSWKNECETKVEQKYVPSQSGMVKKNSKFVAVIIIMWKSKFSNL